MSKEIDLILESLEQTAYRGVPVQPPEVVGAARLASQQRMFSSGKQHSWQLVLYVQLDGRHSGADTWHFPTHLSAMQAYKRVLRRLYRSRRLQLWQICMERKAAGNIVSILHQEEGP